MTRRLTIFLVLALSAGILWSQEASTATDVPGEVRLHLPPSIPLLAGVESNLYFDNAFLALNPANFLADVTCAKGAQQAERWTWTPKAEDAGKLSLKVEIRDTTNAIVASASTTLFVKDRAVAKVPEKPVSLLIIGDSLTAASVYSQQIHDLAVEDDLPLRLIGTRGPTIAEGEPPSPNQHEGYGGWTAERFATHYTGIARGGPYKECGSPFIYKDDGDEKPRLDFDRYCREFNEGAGPDYVTILLGCNDTFGATDDTIEEKIDIMFRHYETLLAMIHELRPETRIGALLPMPPAASQDAFGANYGSGQTRWQYRRNQHRVVERMLQTFGGREAENVFLVPAWLNLDPVHGFPAKTEPAHSRSTAEVTRQSNGVHPSADGYRQIGDAVYAWLRSFDTPAQ
ncbi:MAG: SGNH/GDSL hydrolase family protein [Verrucomicrobiae bacterium]|nr:SGNH/GDSL hydrolase family protein [Verrucomicrobiae bacterium]